MQAVLHMLEEIGSKENIPKALERAKNKQDPFRLMGFGHRVYKTFDPRAKVMRKVCHEILEHLKIQCALSPSMQKAGRAVVLHGKLIADILTCVGLGQRVSQAGYAMLSAMHSQSDTAADMQAYACERHN